MQASSDVLQIAVWCACSHSIFAASSVACMWSVRVWPSGGLLAHPRRAPLDWAESPRNREVRFAVRGETKALQGVTPNVANSFFHRTICIDPAKQCT